MNFVEKKLNSVEAQLFQPYDADGRNLRIFPSENASFRKFKCKNVFLPFGLDKNRNSLECTLREM